jgi:general secretion pathway protein I
MKITEDKTSCLPFFCDSAHDRGFTLIEVIVAMLILGITLVMIMQLFSGGLKASRTSCDYTRAVLHAKDKMEELSVFQVQDSGEFEDGYQWESMVETYKEIEGVTSKLLKLSVKVYWGSSVERKREIELVSLKMVEEEENL